MSEQENAAIEASCPAFFMTNDYFEGDFHNTFHEQYPFIKYEVSNLEQWHVKHRTTQQTTGETLNMQINKLPEIKLPIFNGTY